MELPTGVELQLPKDTKLRRIHGVCQYQRHHAQAKDEEKRFVPLFGIRDISLLDTLFRPGEHTDMHFHMSPETFLVLHGKASVKGLKGEERIIEKNEIVFFGAKDYYQITNVGNEPLVLVGNRSEAFGGAHVTAKE